jgi:hypothetical protein
VKRRRREPLGLMAPAELAVHRELAYLRAAGAEGGRRDRARAVRHATFRWRKLMAIQEPRQ